MTEQEKLEIAREAAARLWEDQGYAGLSRYYRVGNRDTHETAQSALHAINLMLERGYVPMPSVEDVSHALVYATNDFTGLVNVTHLHAALFPPLTPSRVQIARERLGIPANVSDAEIAAVLDGGE